MENQNNKIGCFACDPECYDAFELLFYPITQELNKGMLYFFLFIFFCFFYGVHMKNFKYVKDYGFKYLRDSKLNSEFQFIKLFKLKIKRNLEGFPFNNTASKDQREKVKESILSAVRSLDLFPASIDLSCNLFFIF